MPKQPNECPVCGYDFEEESGVWICRHCGFTIAKKMHLGIHRVRHFNPSSRDDLDINGEEDW